MRKVIGTYLYKFRLVTWMLKCDSHLSISNSVNWSSLWCWYVYTTMEVISISCLRVHSSHCTIDIIMHATELSVIRNDCIATLW